MNFRQFQSSARPWMMPLAIICGFLFHGVISKVEWVVPYLIFTMLLLTFSRINLRELRFSRVMWLLLCLQLAVPVGVYWALAWVNESLAQAAMICVLCPVATAAPVVTGMLGGKIGKVAAFSVLSNLAVALVAPVMFAWLNPGRDLSFVDEFMAIMLKVAPMLVLPLLSAFLLKLFVPRVHDALVASSGAAFYLWSVSLIIVVGRSVSFILQEPSSYYGVMIAMAVAAALLCVFQFAAGKKIGSLEGDPISAGQSLGQKNTILAIWLALAYLNPVSSVGPAAYVIWQNMFNSYQLYRKMHRETAGTPV